MERFMISSKRNFTVELTKDQSDAYSITMDGKRPKLIFIDGNRGGGKTAYFGIDFIEHINKGYGDRYIGVFLGSKSNKLNDPIRKLKNLLTIDLGIDVRLINTPGNQRLEFPGGEQLLFGYGSSKDDYWNSWHGTQFSRIYIDEITRHKESDFFEMIYTCLRPDINLETRIAIATNSYGVGYSWVKDRFVSNMKDRTIQKVGGDIWSRVSFDVRNNDTLIRNDPNYIQTLDSIKDAMLRDSWFNNSWDLAMGSLFSIFDKNFHALPSYSANQLKNHCFFIRSYDHGFSAPFSVGYWAVVDKPFNIKNIAGQEVYLPEGSAIRIAELYGCDSSKPSNGLKVLANQIADMMLRYESMSGLKGKISKSVADSAIWTEDRGYTINDEFLERGVVFDKANKSPKTRSIGWYLIRSMLASALDGSLKNHQPKLFVCNNCTHWIRSVPVLAQDTKNIDDIEDGQEDHIADETRYALLEIAAGFKNIYDNTMGLSSYSDFVRGGFSQ